MGHPALVEEIVVIEQRARVYGWVGLMYEGYLSSIIGGGAPMVVAGIRGEVVGTSPASLVCGAPMVVAGIRGVNRKNACVNVM